MSSKSAERRVPASVLLPKNWENFGLLPKNREKSGIGLRQSLPKFRENSGAVRTPNRSPASRPHPLAGMPTTPSAVPSSVPGLRGERAEPSGQVPEALTKSSAAPARALLELGSKRDISHLGIVAAPMDHHLHPRATAGRRRGHQADGGGGGATPARRTPIGTGHPTMNERRSPGTPGPTHEPNMIAFATCAGPFGDRGPRPERRG